jgi:hypothetical protein
MQPGRIFGENTFSEDAGQDVPRAFSKSPADRDLGFACRAAVAVSVVATLGEGTRGDSAVTGTALPSEHEKALATNVMNNLSYSPTA